MQLENFAESKWVAASGGLVDLPSAITGDIIAQSSSQGLNFEAMLHHARTIGGPNLRKLTFHDRAYLLKDLAIYLNERKDELYDLSYETGATKADGAIDIDGGIATVFVFSSKGRSEMPDDQIYIDGNLEIISRKGTFLGQHIATPLHGAAIHINAFNFPVWGMLEKLAPTFLAGVPAIIKPATSTSYLTEACFRMMVSSCILPEGSIQLICGGVGDLLDHVTSQDVISFTGSKWTAAKLRQLPAIMDNSTRFVAEQDSLNCAILGPDAGPDTPEFDLFIKEVVQEMTVKAGQKCTAIRRAIVPATFFDAATEALTARLASVTIGNPRSESVRMGALCSLDQRLDVMEKVNELRVENDVVFGDAEGFEVVDADKDVGAFMSPILMRCTNPDEKRLAHAIEAFGPVSTIMPYDKFEDAIRIANLGDGSLVGSLYTYDGQIAREIALGAGAYHGRLFILDRDSAKESTGHGSPLPHLVHGGPGRAGGGEEMGGIRGVMHYMQRTAIQGSPNVITAVTNRWTKGATEIKKSGHPFTHFYEELEIGETIHTAEKLVTLEDIEHFADFAGDKFYAHMIEEAAAANPFFEGRVAHGYLILSFAAGLFVEPNPGPVLANVGLDNLAFTQPVYPGDKIKVRLTVKQKNQRNDDYGQVRWDVEVTNEKGESCATYDLLTMNAYKNPKS